MYVKSQVRHFLDNSNKMAAVKDMVVTASLKAESKHVGTELGYRRTGTQV
jgi:hypothetical protein